MAYGDHLILSPFYRWCILVGYWSTLAYLVVIPYGYVNRLLYEQTWEEITLNWFYVVSVIVHIPIFLSSWTYAAYTFHRPLSIFSTIIYPLGHIIDSLMWYAVFDFGKYVLSVSSSSSSLSPSSSSSSSSPYHEPKMWNEFFAGYIFFSIYIFLHRKTFEVWYLPEHHPPRHVRGGLWYVICAIISSIFFALIYYWYNDLRWCIFMKYIIDLYCCIRMRLPSPWMPYMNEHEKDKKWDWTGF